MLYCEEIIYRKKYSGRVTDEELFTRLLYYGIVQLHLSRDEMRLMPFSFLMDLWMCHKQYTGIEKPKVEHYIGEVFPAGPD